ncbi:hypothetical protein GS429_04675 [Natronorubrum sp. JWXQ-INN-674]|uniref:Uncharacterized protein n=1 Tax=Natronorubrum halalkaliphilum TaxID=2691917 RepID=A0A6B0VLB2_9EURY|nr:hypothetical protein [Natronorubrum halalkaliphilum]MXV61369.1 hypothetical protein [Natronorubrum halalkaliphilum]
MSRTPSAIGLALVTLPAAALVAISGILAYRPALLIESVPELRPLFEAINPGLVTLTLVALFVVFAPIHGLVGRLRPSATTPLTADGSASDTGARFGSSIATDQQSVVGASADGRITLVTAYDEEPRETRENAREALLESLRPIAATAYANAAGCSNADATAAIEAGSWTDDPRAAAFLAGAEGPSTPLWLWLFDLVTAADPFERSLERTLAEIERVQATATVAGPRRDGADAIGTVDAANGADDTDTTDAAEPAEEVSA